MVEIDRLGLPDVEGEEEGDFVAARTGDNKKGIIKDLAKASPNGVLGGGVLRAAKNKKKIVPIKNLNIVVVCIMGIQHVHGKGNAKPCTNAQSWPARQNVTTKILSLGWPASQPVLRS